MKNIKNIIPIEIKRKFRINDWVTNKRRARIMKLELVEFSNYMDVHKLEKKIFILDACDHKNLGDQAILMAEFKFIEKTFPGYKLISVGLGKYDDYISTIQKYVKPQDMFFLHGGGNLGNEYKKAEKIRRSIIQLFPDNKIILFPQTMFFTHDDEGRKELVKSKLIYNNHNNLILVARERTSYKLMKENFVNSTVLLTPDIVLSLNRTYPMESRNGALFCCRNDIEGLLSKGEKDEVLSTLNKSFRKVTITDTVGENTFESVENKFIEFKQAEIIITDRLHGMVFAAITGTPCIALSNYNYKVKGTYEWISHLEYIKFAHSIDQIPKYVEELKGMKNTVYDNNFTQKHYDQIIDAIDQLYPLSM